MSGGPAGPGVLDAWIERVRQLRATALPGGTLDYIDAESRRRGAAAIRSGTGVNLARRLDPTSSAFRLTATFDVRDRITVGFDRVEVSQHGIEHTHLDGWSHYGVDGTFFPGVPTDRPEQASVEPWADQGVITRAVLLDVPAVRGTAWVDAGQPVTGEDLDQALALAGSELQAGDAVLVYMGRDRFEQAGHTYRTIPDAVTAGEPRSGLGASAAEWIARRRVSVVCWDFLDAVADGEPRASVHLLVWSIGLGLVDNCDLGPVREALRTASRSEGMLVLAPLRLPGATASLVSPLLVY